MAFPSGWPPVNRTSLFSVRFFRALNATEKWSDNAYLFVHPTSGFPMLSKCLRLDNDSSVAIEYSFRAENDLGSGPNDGDNAVDGRLAAGEHQVYEYRHELGIALRNAGGAPGSNAVRITAW